MKQRGRKSAANASSPALKAPRRAKPPIELTERQAEHWTRIASSMPAAWFTPASLGMLADLCQWTVMREDCEYKLRMNGVLDLPPQVNAQVRKQIVDEAAQASRMIMALQTKMRLTHQSQRSPDAGTTAAKRATAERKPWQ